MKRLLTIAALAMFAATATAEPKLAKPVDLEKTGKAIRAGKLYVGKTYALPEKNRFHNIHDVALGLPCNGCHNVAGYADDTLFLRKSEFPLQVDGEDVGGVARVKCLACHSEGGAGRPFYNVTKK